MQTCHQLSLSASHFFLLLTFGQEKRKHAAYQNNGKTYYSENQIPNIKILSVTIHGINIIHSLKNSGDNLRLACPSPISQ